MFTGLIVFCTCFYQLVICESTATLLCTKLSKENSKDGVFKIAGFFPVRRQHTSLASRNGVIWVETMKYAISQANKKYGRNIFGYDIYDSCGSLEFDVITSAILDIFISDARDDYSLSNETDSCPCSYTKSNLDRFIGIVGPAASSNSMYINKVIRFKHIPMISYASTSPQLSNMARYPNFFRTVPSDTFQARFVKSVLLTFDWTYVSIVVADDSYGRTGMDVLQQELKTANICTERKEMFSVPMMSDKINKILERLHKIELSNVIILWGSYYQVKTFLQYVSSYGLHNKTWIISEASGRNAWFHSPENNLHGDILVIVPISGNDKAFEEIFLNKTYASNMWVQALFHNLLGLNYTNRDENITLRTFQNLFDFSSRVGFVQDAVETYTTAFENYVKDKYACHLNVSYCKTAIVRNHKEFVDKYIKPIKFKGLMGETISYDINGNVNFAAFDLYLTKKHERNFQLVARWTSSNNLTIENSNDSNIIALGKIKSQCSDICQPGYYPIVNKARSCCWLCSECQNGYVKPFIGQELCKRCPQNYMTNGNKSKCMKIKLLTLDQFKETHVIYTISTAGLILTVCFILTFIYSRNTPVVRSTNLNTSMIQLLTLLTLFILPNILVGEDTVIKCIVRVYGTWILFTLIISITLAKASLIINVFQLKQSSNTRKKIQLKTSQLFIVVSSIVLEICLIVILTNHRPTIVHSHVVDRSTYKVYKVCNRNKDYIYQFSYTIFLQVICGVQSFRGRHLPENYNEATYITFATFSSTIVIASGIPIIKSRLSYIEKDLTLLIVVVISNFLYLVILYGQKVKIIWCNPGRNTKVYFEKQRNQYVQKQIKRKLLPRKRGPTVAS